MNSRPQTESTNFRPTMVQGFLHLSALNAFSLVQPILDSLINNVAFLRYYDYSPVAVIIVIVLLTLTIPTLVTFSSELLARLGFLKTAHFVRAACIVIFFLLAMLYAARWLSTRFTLAAYGISEDIVLIPAIFTSIWLGRLYFRVEALRQFLSCSAVGVLLYPAVFFLNPAIQEQVLRIPARQYYQSVVAKTPAPVIFIVFDGLSGMALLDKDHKIDRELYPAFASLSDRCSFYRNVSTVHTRTDHALPAILSGSFPTGAQLPVESEYPLNLFRLLDNSRQFEQTIFEPYTQLAPEHLQRIKHPDSILRQTLDLMDTLLRVFERMCMPRSFESLAVDVPREWFRMLPPNDADPQTLDGKIVYNWDTDQDLQIDHFLKCVRPTEVPALRFLHLALPHDPWTRLASGEVYRRVLIGRDLIPGEKGGNWQTDDWLVQQGWQRYLLQVQFADHCLGRILDRLESTDLFDASMIIVTADHGFAFRAGCSRRDVTGETLSDLIPVPLLIKYPHQSQSSVSDKNVETIDILPTVADVLGLPQDSGWDGQSLLSDAPERPRKTVVGLQAALIESGFPGRFRYVERLHEVFGQDAHGEFTDLQFLPELRGQEARLLQGAKPSELRLQLNEGYLPREAERQGLIPCYYCGLLRGLKSPDKPTILAVAVNGRIEATTRTSTDPESFEEWAVLIPPDAVSSVVHQLQFFEVALMEKGVELRELRLE